MSERTLTNKPKTPREPKTPKARASTGLKKSPTAHPSSSKNKQPTRNTVKLPTTATRLDAIGIDAICEMVADCVTLREIAESIGISKGSLLAWLAGHADQYTRAREAQAEILASDILRLADECRIGTIKTERANGDVEIRTADMVDRARLQIDARKWLAGKMSPKKYGEKIQHGGADDLPPIKTEEQVSPREIARRIAFALSIGLKDAQNPPE